MSQPKIQLRKHLNADTLFENIHTEFEKIPDLCAGDVEISVADALTSGFAMFSLKDPSLLAFDQRRKDETKLKNLKSIYHIGVVPCDTQMRVILDEVNTEELAPVFADIFRRAQRGKVLEQLVFLDNCSLLSLDGTQYFSSNTIHCSSCLEKANSIGLRSGEYDGRNSTHAPRLLINCSTFWLLWKATLSMITTSPGDRVGAS